MSTSELHKSDTFMWNLLENMLNTTQCVCRIRLDSLVFSETFLHNVVHDVTDSAPPPSGENMTVLNTADWLLGCSTPPTAPSTKDYGILHVCVE